MSDVVIIVGTKRGNESVPAIEIKQMSGRAGRKHGGEACLVHIVVEEEREADVRLGMDSDKHMEVHSQFGAMDSMFFHLMPEISSGRVVIKEDAERWFSRSLTSHQGKKVDFQKVFAGMEKEGSIVRIKDRIKPTDIGIIATDLYFHPGDVQSWKNNFSKLFELGIENDSAAVAWALGNRTHSKSRGDFGDNRYVINECKSAMPFGLDIEPGTVIQVVLWWCLMGGPSAGKMRNQMLELRDDIGRIKRALVRLDREAGWGKSEFFDEMEMMVKKGINSELVDLCRFPGITKGRADFLYEKGVRDEQGIADILDSIEDEIDEPFLEVLRGIKSGISRKSG